MPLSVPVTILDLPPRTPPALDPQSQIDAPERRRTLASHTLTHHPLDESNLVWAPLPSLPFHGRHLYLQNPPRTSTTSIDLITASKFPLTLLHIVETFQFTLTRHTEPQITAGAHSLRLSSTPVPTKPQLSINFRFGGPAQRLCTCSRRSHRRIKLRITFSC